MSIINGFCAILWFVSDLRYVVFRKHPICITFVPVALQYYMYVLPC